jgi:hypothetical protein
VAFLVTRRGLAMSRDEGISGSAAGAFGLASQFKGVSNQVAIPQPEDFWEARRHPQFPLRFLEGASMKL